jgi:DNA-binding MarR family transcriptional regulator
VEQPGALDPEARWTFVTNHLVVLLCIAEDPGVKMVDIAARVGITERGVQRIVADLVRAGYLSRTRVGRRNHYEINDEMPLRHLETQHRRVRELLLAKDTPPQPRGSGGKPSLDTKQQATHDSGIEHRIRGWKA